MIALPGGAFTMGSDENPTEKPVHEARVRPFADRSLPGHGRRMEAVRGGEGLPLRAGRGGCHPVLQPELGRMRSNT